MNMEVTHADLSKVTGMVLVKVDAMMMLTTSVSATSRMLPVFADATMAVRDVATQLPGLLLIFAHLI